VADDRRIPVLLLHVPMVADTGEDVSRRESAAWHGSRI
jgi:hypothetical protein